MNFGGWYLWLEWDVQDCLQHKSQSDGKDGSQSNHSVILVEPLGKLAGSVHGVLSANGGILPAVRCRSSRSLSLTEREEISRGIAAGASMRKIAAIINRSPSTVSREISRNGGSTYRAVEADSKAWHQACSPKPCHLVKFPILQGIVAHKLSVNWSPAQIAGWLKQQYPEDGSMRISHETIYRSLFIQERGKLKKE